MIFSTAMRRTLRSDLFNMVVQSRLWLVVVGLLPFVSLVRLLIQTSGDFGAAADLSAVDLMIFFSRGSEVFVPRDGAVFVLPMDWLFAQVSLFFVTGFYSARTFRGDGAPAISRIGSLRRWWASQCLCVVILVTCFYAYCALIFFGYGLISGGPLLDIHSNLIFSGQENILSPTIDGGVILALVTPYTSSLLLCLLQLVLALVMGVPASIGMMAAYLALSAYAHVPYLMGDYGMLMRNGAFFSGGASSSTILLLEGIACVACVLIGRLLSSRWECLDVG